jgi:uncharacterized membrane protein
MKKKLVVVGILLLCIMIYLAGCTSTSDNGNKNNNNNNPSPQQNETEVRIPLTEITTTASFYSYDSDGVTIRYFAVKDTQGTVHVAFDACDVCYEAKKGYKQDGAQMQCLNCGQQFAITSIGTENIAGGCWPSFLNRSIDGNDIVIKIADLEAKRFMF